VPPAQVRARAPLRPVRLVPPPAVGPN